jgi:hypothetical protein
MLQVGDIIAVYVEDPSEQIMLERIQLPQLGQADAEYTWMGRINVGDKVMLVHKFDPIANGIANRC